MTEMHLPMSAVAGRFESEIAALAQQYYEQEGRPEGRAMDHWLRAEREVEQRAARQRPPTEQDMVTEEAMHLHM